jgi:SOS response regulatory protein OraA/RecX
MLKMDDSASLTLRYALKLLAARDFSEAELRRKLQARFGDVPQSVIQTLLDKRFVDDRRFAENYVARRQDRAAARLRRELIQRGVEPSIIDTVLSGPGRPSLHEVVKATMVDWDLRPPLQPRDAARLFRALARLGYDEDAIREEVETFNEQ